MGSEHVCACICLRGCTHGQWSRVFVCVTYSCACLRTCVRAYMRAYRFVCACLCACVRACVARMLRVHAAARS